MSYIGKSPSIGAYSMLDSLTASATASYSLTLDSVAFVPESANHLIVSLNGHIQKAGSSFTVSSSTLTFSSALTSSDSIDFVLALGSVLDIGTPSDATVTNAKTNFVSTSSAAGLQIKGDGTTDGTLQLNCSQNSHGIKLKSPAHSASASYTLTFPTTDGSADEFLKTDGSGVLSWASAGGGRYTLISTATIGGGTTYVDMDSVISDTYKNYLLVATGIDVNTDGEDLHIQVKNSSGVVSGSSDYLTSVFQRSSNTDSHAGLYDTGQSYHRLNSSGTGNTSTESANLYIQLYNLRSTSHHKLIFSQMTSMSTGSDALYNLAIGAVKTTTALTGLRLKTASGNLDAGVLKLYGAND